MGQLTMSRGKGAAASPANPSNSQRIKRTCLKCDQKFLAKSRFNRICPSCREMNREIEAEWFRTEVHLR
jgi:Zn finger protein HypA/HybF involved in hydrogenase expression